MPERPTATAFVGEAPRPKRPVALPGLSATQKKARSGRFVATLPPSVPLASTQLVPPFWVS